jgi:prepilin-type N-terminal cleavage/methylation domain-containing protein
MNARTAPKWFHRQPPAAACWPRAFTLIEIMVVVAIIGIIMAAGAPTLFRMLHKEGFRKSISDIVEVCTAARARAILQGTTTKVVFHPREGYCELSGGAGPSGGLAHTARFDEGARVEMLDVNLNEYKDAEEAEVRFYPNGTCDEMTLILVSDKNEWRKISLEITTGLASVETDPNKWR